jgi:hypothetical protein
MIFFLNNTFNKLDIIIEPITKYYLNVSISFFATNYLYNKLNNRFGITIERLLDAQYIFIFCSFVHVITYVF